MPEANRHHTTLAQVALHELDPSWLPMFAPELVHRARRQPLGRRWLADRLAGSVSLQRDLRVHSNELQPPQLPDWLFRPLPDQACLALGAHAHGALIKTAVARSQVARLRELLGASLYIQVLNAPPPGEGTSGIELLLKAEDPALEERFRHQGAVELYHLALSIHPLAAERLQLAFPKSWQLASGHPRLKTEQARQWLDQALTAVGDTTTTA